MNGLVPLMVLGVGALSLDASAVDVSKLPPASTKTGLTYARDIRPIFEATCFHCHGEERARGGLRLDSLDAVHKGGDDGKVIKPGKSVESALVLAVAQLDDETAMPPKRQGRGGGPGGPGGPGGFGGRGGGRGGFGPAMMLGNQMLSQGDKNGDQMLSKAEMTNLADAWFDMLDAEKTGKLTQEQFAAKLGGILPPPQGFGGRGPGGPAGPGAVPRGPGQGQGQGGPRQGRGGFNPGAFMAPGLFAATDTDKDGSLTRVELKATFAKWFADWDKDKSGFLMEEKLREGLNTALPRPEFGGRGQGGFGGGNRGFGGPGGPGGQGGPGGPGGPGDFGGGGAPPQPLTAEQVGLIRAWVDQGAK